MSFRELYDIRDANNSDKNFILATFLRGVYYGDSWFSMIPKDIFMNKYKVLAAKLVNDPKMVIKIACLPEDPDVILGYSIMSPDYQAVVWCFVKTAWRRKGIARSLLPQHPVAVTHLTALGKSLLNKFPNAVFNPFYPL